MHRSPRTSWAVAWLDLRRAVWLLPVVGLAALSPVALKRHTIEAERFVLRDAKGMERGSFAVTDSGSVVLRLLDAGGEEVLKVQVEKGHPEISLVGPAAGQEVALGCASDGSAVLVLRSDSGTSAALAAGGFARNACLTMGACDMDQGVNLSVDDSSAVLEMGQTNTGVRAVSTGSSSSVSVGGFLTGDFPKAQMRASISGPDPADLPCAEVRLSGMSSRWPPDIRAGMTQEEVRKCLEESLSPSIKIGIVGSEEGTLSISRQGGGRVWQAP